MLFDPGCANCGCPDPASPCGFPLADLTLSYTFNRLGAVTSGTTSLVYLGPLGGGISHRWFTGLIQVVSGAVPQYQRVLLECWTTAPASGFPPGPYVSTYDAAGTTLQCSRLAFPRTAWTTSPPFAEFTLSPGTCLFTLLTVTP